VKKLLFILSILVLFGSCKSRQELPVAAAPVEIKVPLWVSSRPNNGFKYIGIGFAEKGKGADYQMAAKKAALYDLASEIKTNISSNSVLYTVQNNNNFNENFNSLIQLSNTDNLEGYTLVDAYENEKQYWVYYMLDKQQYADAKALKKQQTITKAGNLIASSFYDERNKDFSACLKKRIQAFGVLTPYLSEEILFDASLTNGIKTIFDLTNLIQQQLQNISVVTQPSLPVLKPYQPSYLPLSYRLQISGKTPLQNFPFVVNSDDDRVSVVDHAFTNSGGDMQLKVTTVEPVNQRVAFSLSPDVNTLMGSDSVGRAGLVILSQFISTNKLKVQAEVRNITLHISSVERNLGLPTDRTALESFIREKFQGQEIRLVDNANEADYLIEVVADTKEDVGSAILEANYSVKLASLLINVSLKSRSTMETLYKTQIIDLYGYANELEKAGMNAYASPKLNTKLAEAIFFLNRKIVVY
jgi:hypothetical protein